MAFVNILIKNISEYSEADVENLMDRISPKRREIVMKRRDTKDKIRACVCEMLLWQGLYDLGMEIEALEVSYEDQKPKLCDRYAKIMIDKTGMDESAMNVGLDFSFSHAGDYVACAISDAPIGIDVEGVRKNIPLYSEHIFSKTEEDAVKNSKDEKKEFLKYWTCKESFIKCAYPKQVHLNTIELDMTSLPFAIETSTEILSENEKDNYRFQVEELDENNIMSFCVKTSNDYLLKIIRN